MQKQQRSTLPALIIFILVLIAGLYYVKPLWEEVQALSLTHDQQTIEKDTLNTKLQDLKKLESELKSGSEVSTQTTLNAIPVRLEQDRIITELTDIAEKNDVALNSTNFGFANNALDKIKKATINVNLTGNESQLNSFLRSVETSERKFVVKSITVQSSKTDGTNVPRINFTLLIETYYQSSF